MDKIRRIVREFITEKEYKQLLGEGLIVTRNPYTVTNTINRWYSKGVIAKNYKSEDGSLGVIELTFKVKDKETSAEPTRKANTELSQVLLAIRS